MKKRILMLLMIIAVLFTIGCGEKEETEYKITSDIVTAKMYVGDVITPKITVEPVADLTWTTDKEGIVKIENGSITALSIGTVRVKATIGIYFAVIDVNVVEDYLTVGEDVELKPGEEAKIDAKSNRSIAFESSNSEIVTVDATGSVKAIATGTTTIVVKAGQLQETINVTVVKVDQITANVAEVTVEKDETVALEVQANCEFTYESKDTSIATVKDGVVTGVAKGSTVIVVKSTTSEVSVEIAVTVTVTVEDPIKLSKSGVKVSQGSTIEITATSKSPVVWSTDDASIATVSDGVITGVTPGTTCVKASSVSGKTVASCKVVVEEILLNLTFVKDSIPVGKTIIPITKNNAAVEWESSDSKVFTVDANGNVKAIGVGTAIITMKSVVGDKEIKVTLTAYEEKENEELNAYLDQLFLEFIGDDPYSINTYLYHPEAYNLEEKDPVPSEKYTIESEAEYFEELRGIKEKLLSFDYKVLPRHQQIDIDVIMDYVNKTLAYDGYYYYGTSFGSYLGYQAQLPMVLSEYRFDDKKDIDNYLEYIKNVQADFEALVDFEYQKLEVGNALPDGIIDRVIDQCNTFLDSEEVYLIVIFDYNISELEFLTEEDRAFYSQKNKDYINQYFMPAYQYLVDEMTTLKGKNFDKIVGGFAQYNIGDVLGKDYYEVKFQDEIGTDMTCNELIKFLEDLIDEAYEGYVSASSKVQSNYNVNLMTKYKLTLDTLVPYFMNLIKKDFPALNVEFNYTIKDVHSSMQDNFSPAAYFISPIDDNISEVIYVNPKDFTEYDNSMYQTIAHEGYPGHMFQNIHKKNSDLPDVRKILHFGGYSEGWAVYIENFVLKYTYSDQETLNYFHYNDSLVYLIIGRADVGVNYQGWDEEKLGEYLVKYLNVDAAGIKDLYYDLIEIPTNYLKYYFSYFTILDIRDKFKKEMGSAYSDLLFHTIFLETGPCSFNVLRDVYEQYASDYKYIK